MIMALQQAASKAAETASFTPEVIAAIISASALVLVAVIGAALSRYFDRRQQIEQEQRQRKAEVYAKFLEYWFWAMRERSKASEKEKRARQLEYQREIPQKLAVWGSEAFVKEYGAWFHSDRQQGSILEFESLIRTIRADLGFKDKDLVEGDLLKLSNKGVNEYLQQHRTSSVSEAVRKEDG